MGVLASYSKWVVTKTRLQHFPLRPANSMDLTHWNITSIFLEALCFLHFWTEKALAPSLLPNSLYLSVLEHYIWALYFELSSGERISRICQLLWYHPTNLATKHWDMLKWERYLGRKVNLFIIAKWPITLGSRIFPLKLWFLSQEKKMSVLLKIWQLVSIIDWITSTLQGLSVMINRQPKHEPLLSVTHDFITSRLYTTEYL